MHGIRASTQHAFGSSELNGLGILVQGLGGVGGHLAELLTEAGARVLVADVDPDRVVRAVRTLGAAPVDAADVIGTDCDVLAPCAVGGVLDAAAVDTLRCRVVAGAANNQLAEPSIARRLRDRGVSTRRTSSSTPGASCTESDWSSSAGTTTNSSGACAASVTPC